MLRQEPKHYNDNMKNIDYPLVGQKIKNLRMEAKLTQERMAEICGISTSFLGHIERGSRKLSLETAVKIADCLHVSMDSLIIEGKQTDFSILSAVEAILRKQERTKQEQFLRLLKVLSQNIEELWKPL